MDTGQHVSQEKISCLGINLNILQHLKSCVARGPIPCEQAPYLMSLHFEDLGRNIPNILGNSLRTQGLVGCIQKFPKIFQGLQTDFRDIPSRFQRSPKHILEMFWYVFSILTMDINDWIILNLFHPCFSYYSKSITKMDSKYTRNEFLWGVSQPSWT